MSYDRWNVGAPVWCLGLRTASVAAGGRAPSPPPLYARASSGCAAPGERREAQVGELIRADASELKKTSALTGAGPHGPFLSKRIANCELHVVRAVGDAKPQDEPPRLDQRMFLWASYGLGQDEVWWPTDLVNGYKRGPECRSRINSTCT
jgi:hypothetical protein